MIQVVIPATTNGLELTKNCAYIHPMAGGIEEESSSRTKVFFLNY